MGRIGRSWRAGCRVWKVAGFIAATPGRSRFEVDECVCTCMNCVWYIYKKFLSRRKNCRKDRRHGWRSASHILIVSQRWLHRSVFV